MGGVEALPADRREHIVAPGFATTGVAPHSVSTPMLAEPQPTSQSRQYTKYAHSRYTNTTTVHGSAYLRNACLPAAGGHSAYR